jgi:XTP/dITP diphosphohydrolase
MDIIFASNNNNKLEEISSIIGGGIQIISLQQAGIHQEIPEPYETLEENALAKSRFIFSKTNVACFADDTGLEIQELNGAPGVHSAHFSGSRDSNLNMQKVLELLKGKENRKARFRTVISLIIQNREYFFEGLVQGEITLSPSGEAGFGYDPIFRPLGYCKTFAQMNLDEKNQISHRKMAIEKLAEFLKGK